MFQSKFRAYIAAFLLSFILIFHPEPALANISTHRVGVMRNIAPIGAGIIRNAYEIIADLVFNQIAGGPGTIITEGNLRIDIQGQTREGDLNLQVQINGMHGGSTIAAALIPNRYFNGITNPHTMAEVQRVVRSALIQSFESLRNGNPGIFGLEGDPSN